MFLVSFLYHRSSRSGWTSHGRVVIWKLLEPSSASAHVLWNQFPTPLGVDKAIQRPPVDNVGYKPVHSSPRFSMWAASSSTSKERASDRPASPDVDAALMEEPLDSSKELRLSTSIVAILSQSGRLRMMLLTFFTKFPAVANFVAMTRIALSRWNNIIQTMYPAVTVDIPSCRAFKITLNR